MAAKYERLIALGEERVAVINNMLATGSSCQTVARLIQQEWKQYQDVAEKTLMQQLMRYKIDTIESVKIAHDLALPKEHPKVKALERRMDVLGEMIELANAQKTRVMGFIEREKDLKMPIKGTSDDINMLMNLYKDVQKVQFELGIDTYQGPLLAGKTMQQRVTTADGTVIETQTTEAVQGALQILEERRRRRNAIEGEASVVSGSASDPD